jgi:TPR repeat protein
MKAVIQVFHPFGSGRREGRWLVFPGWYVAGLVLIVLGLFPFGFPLWAEEEAKLSPSWEAPGCSRSAKQWDRCLELARDAYARGETEIAYIRTHWGMMADLAGKRWDELSDYSNKNLVLKVSEDRLQAWAKVCASGDPLACFLVADGYEMRKDFEQAVKYYERMCGFGSAVGCAYLGLIYDNGRMVPEDDRRAMELYRKACDMGSAVGCNKLGLMYDNGKGAPEDDRRAVEFYRKACDIGNALGCNNLGSMYDNGEGVPEDDRRAVELYRKACDMGYAVGCYNLGVMYEKGEGVSKDYVRALELYRKACDMGVSKGCEALRKLREY